MILGLLLARAGVEVTVLEKHGDFLRDFRGDTVHPSTLRLLDELGLWERFAELTYSEVHQAAFDSRRGPVALVDFDRLRLPHRYVALVPQWDLLNLLAEAARQELTFTLAMNTAATGLLTETGRVVGVRYTGPDGPGELRAELTVACDGRTSVLRQAAGLAVREFPVGFDVLWFRLPRTEPDTAPLVPRLAPGQAAVLIPRPGYFQIAYLIPKGTDAAVRAAGIAAFRARLGVLLPDSAAQIATLASMDDVKHLDVRVNRLRRWHTDGLLCLGDAAHAMSPVGGVGINLAVQDAVAAATLLAGPLRAHRVRGADLARVRRRRLAATVLTQSLQLVLHRVLAPALRGADITPPEAVAAVLRRLPWLAVIPAYLIGVGVRAERAPAFARRAPGGSVGR